MQVIKITLYIYLYFCFEIFTRIFLVRKKKRKLPLKINTASVNISARARTFASACCLAGWITHTQNRHTHTHMKLLEYLTTNRFSLNIQKLFLTWCVVGFSCWVLGIVAVESAQIIISFVPVARVTLRASAAVCVTLRQDDCVVIISFVGCRFCKCYWRNVWSRSCSRDVLDWWVVLWIVRRWAVWIWLRFRILRRRSVRV